jgi:hypothetical protein
MDHQVLAADSYVCQSPLVAAVHPGREDPTVRASRLTDLGGHRDPNRPTPREHPLNPQPSKVREQQTKIAARSTVFRDSLSISALRDRRVTECVPEPEN